MFRYILLVAMLIRGNCVYAELTELDPRYYDLAKEYFDDKSYTKTIFSPSSIKIKFSRETKSTIEGGYIHVASDVFSVQVQIGSLIRDKPEMVIIIDTGRINFPTIKPTIIHIKSAYQSKYKFFTPGGGCNDSEQNVLVFVKNKQKILWNERKAYIAVADCGAW